MITSTLGDRRNAWCELDREKYKGKGRRLIISERRNTPSPVVYLLIYPLVFGFPGEDRRQSGEDGPGFTLPQSAQIRHWDLFLPDRRAWFCPHCA